MIKINTDIIDSYTFFLLEQLSDLYDKHRPEQENPHREVLDLFETKYMRVSDDVSKVDLAEEMALYFNDLLENN